MQVAAPYTRPGGERLKEMSPLIRYRCANPEHQRKTNSVSDTMTIHDRSWAYCPYDVRVSDHVWSLANPQAPAMQLKALADPPARD